MAFYQDALRLLGRGAAPARALEVVVFGEAAQDDVDRALPVINVVVADVGEDAPFRCFFDAAWFGAWRSAITGRAASRTILSISLSACEELSPRPISATSAGGTSARSPLVSHEVIAGEIDIGAPTAAGHQRETVRALVGDQHTQPLVSAWSLPRATGSF